MIMNGTLHKQGNENLCQVLERQFGGKFHKMLDAGLWILEKTGILLVHQDYAASFNYVASSINSLSSYQLYSLCGKDTQNRSMMLTGTTNGKIFIPAKDGIFDQHPASSIQHPGALLEQLFQ